MGNGRTHVPDYNPHRIAIIRAAADCHSVRENRRPFSDFGRGTGQSSSRENHPLSGVSSFRDFAVTARDTQHPIGLFVIKDFLKRSVVVDFDSALIAFTHQDVDIVLAVIGFLTDSSRIRVSVIGLPHTRSQPMIHHPVKRGT